ncbi:hypothetical protein [Microcoleus sp. Pol7_B1]|jgi:hypothetical protein|uniref:hypothetical protein n=1 Tax=Microcoleus sp. Pol7_B1 TaxID=2818894 RepID=UPI002FD45EFD
MPRRLSVLLPTILVCCVIIILRVAFYSIGYMILVPVWIAGALAGPLTLLYLGYDKGHLIVAALSLTALLLAMILAHPIKTRRWAAIITIIGVCIWMSIGFYNMSEILSRMAT